MTYAHNNRPIASVAGIAVLAVWTVYLVLALASIPDVPYRMMINGFFGILAGLAVIFSYRHWRFAVVLASCVYLVVYVVQLVRMTGMTAGSELPLFSALLFYYSASWTVATGVFVERGISGGLAHGILEYAMPILVIVLIALVLSSRVSPTRPPGA